MRTILLGVVYVILIFVLLLVLLIFWPFGQREPLLRLGRWAMSLAPGVLGIKINVSGRDRIDGKTPYIFMSNHLSFLDGLMGISRPSLRRCHQWMSQHG